MKRSGISLIVLIITIIVVIILAAVVILTLTKNNPIESAKEARFKEDVRTFQDELSLYISKQYANAGGHWDGNISAKSYNEIAEYIPSFTKKYEGKFVINNNNLEYTNKLDAKEKEYAQSLNVKERGSLLPDEFRKVEYLESTGTQWITTNVQQEYLDLKFDFEIEYLFNYSEYAKSFIGDSSGNFYVGGTGVGWYTISYNGEKYNSNKLVLDKKTSNVVKVAPGIQEWSVDNKIMMSSNISTPLNSNKPISLFAGRIYAGDFGKPTKIKLYNMKIYVYSKNKILEDLIPCYSTTIVTNADGVQVPANTKGLYDTVEEKFYTNQGTGEFIAGPDVDE